jgi:DNA adenine methylase
MPIINNPELYKRAKEIADKKYAKPSAYKSGFIVKTYKDMGGTYSDDNQPKNLDRWYKEEWADIGGKEYPVYRPTKRITKDTPLTASEIDPAQAKKQIELKQKIKGDANLPAFKAASEDFLRFLEGEPQLDDKYVYVMEGGDLKPFFSRQGNKFLLRDRIIPFIPPHKRYVELFAGSGAIFFNKDKAEENILNDLDKTTYNNFRLIKSAPTDMSSYSNIDISTVDKVKQFYTKHINAKNTTPVQLILNKVISSTGFSGKPVPNVNGIYKTFEIKRSVDRLPEYKEKLKGAKILNQDYAKVVDKYDSKDTFFFIDPPYENTDKSFKYAEDEDFDFQRLERTLRSIKGMFFMTINDSKRIRDLFKGFYIKPVNVYAAWGNNTESKIGKVRKELFITNYKIE